ncbi:hypothetical protein MPDQ_004200 [Monascus purpureus]|uniref:Beta-xylosidase C-terminal Concanavalin A-like domain-containing protein n=1 Tax=Monascus purpureus TaxID=5098 RepID=A0A507QLP0_MONPU|nr:hypothetical protein MPDQ_004200 [Monascus purpureus]BDD55732.1 hypothetical protein MAP00_001221 [Monascus purpureus]
MPEFFFANSTDKIPGSNGHLPVDFKIRAPPSTDIWSKPPFTISFNAPILYQVVSLTSFKRARVAFNARWTEIYDQAGLVLVLNGRDGDRKWVKSGIEFAHGRPHLSTVAKDRWADWSLLPVPSDGHAATIEIVREPDNSLWVYQIQGIQRFPIREVTWVFEEGGATEECWIGVYAARPSSEGGDLTVNFGNLVIEQAH